MDFVLRYRKPLLFLVLMLTVVLGLGIFQLQINFSFEDFYPKDDREFNYYRAYGEMFSEDQNHMVYVALKSPAENVFDEAYLEKAHAIFQQVSQVEGIDSAITAFDFSQIKRRGTSFSNQPYLVFTSTREIEKSRQRIEGDPTMVGPFITRDYQYLCGYFFIEEAIFDTRERDIVNDKITDILDESGLEYVISGIPCIRSQYIRKIGIELALFISLSVLLIVTVLFFMYRNIWGVLIPVGTTLTAQVWILGFMGLSGQTVDLINNLLLPIIFVVGMSDIIHLLTKYLSEIKKGRPREEAIRTTMKEIGMAILLTSVTTSIGFASLMISRIPPIREFGFYAACGVMFTYLISVIVIPNALLWLKPERFLKVRSVENQPFWNRSFLLLDQMTLKHPKWTSGLFGLALVASVFLILKIPIDTYLIEDIGKRDPIRTSMEFFAEKSYGLRPFEMGIHIKSPDHQITDREVLVEMDKIQEHLAEREYFSPFVSMATLVEQANYVYHFSRERHKRIPPSQETVDELLALTEINGGGPLMAKFMSEDRRTGRISSRMPDIGTNAFEVVAADLDQFISTQCDTTLFSYKLTGHAYLTEHNLMYVRRSLMGGLMIAFVIIGLIMGMLFKSWKILLISMAPNMIPLIFTGGVMGLFGITLTSSTALVFVIAFGIAVDDTIHFLSRYRLEIEKGKSVDVAVRNSMLGTGKAMILTSLVLLGGFVILLASDFGGTFSVGLFTALTIIFALLADLILLPILLRWIEKKKD